MLAAIAYAAFFQQQLGPMLPPSCSPAFQQAVLEIEAALQQQDFAKAKSLVWLLPKSNFVIDWDDSKVPSGYRNDYRQARDQAIAMWKKQVPNLLVEFKKSADVRVSFEPVLAKDPDSTVVASHVGFFREDPGDVRLDYVIGLKRGQPLQPTGVIDVFDDVAFAIGQYLGIAEGDYDTYTMGHTDLPRIMRTTVSRTELHTVRDNMRAIVDLEKAIKDKKPIVVTKSDLFVDPPVVNAAPTTQGDRVELSFQITNRGNGPLSYSMFPDCGCTIVDDPGKIDGGTSRLLHVDIDTKMFSYDMTKHVVLYTNDPANPVRVVAFKVPIIQRYRLIIPDGATVVVPKAGKKYPVYLIPAPGTKLEPVSEKLDGVNGTVTRQPFKGMLADPDAHEGPKMRTGYKFIVSLKGDLPPGRSFGTLQIYTENAKFSDITLSLNVQSGIIALPDEVNMGTVGQGPRTYSFLVSGPGVPFKVEGASASMKCLKTSVEPVPGSGDYKVTVAYDGKATRGDFIGSIKVRTTNPHQPIIDVPVKANVQ